MTGQHPIAAFKAALRSHLLADAAIVAALPGGVSDIAPRSVQRPFVQMNAGTTRENGTNDAESLILDIDLIIESEERGATAALSIAWLIEKRLGLAFQPAGFRAVLITVRETAIRQDAKAGLARATLKLRGFLDPL